MGIVSVFQSANMDIQDKEFSQYTVEREADTCDYVSGKYTCYNKWHIFGYDTGIPLIAVTFDGENEAIVENPQESQESSNLLLDILKKERPGLFQ